MEIHLIFKIPVDGFLILPLAVHDSELFPII